MSFISRNFGKIHMHEDIKILKEHYPKAIFCVDMNGNKWIQIDTGKYTQVELFNIQNSIYRVWLWGDWYYFFVESSLSNFLINRNL